MDKPAVIRPSRRAAARAQLVFFNANGFLCYAEFAGMMPVAGSAYTYGYAALGELVAWVIGWDLLLEYSLIVAVLMRPRLISLRDATNFATEPWRELREIRI
jgi:hypothetical protein